MFRVRVVVVVWMMVMVVIPDKKDEKDDSVEGENLLFDEDESFHSKLHNKIK